MFKISRMRFHLFNIWNIPRVVFLPIFLVIFMLLMLAFFVLFLVTVISLSMIFCSLLVVVLMYRHFHRNQKYSKYPRFLILADLSNIVVSMVLIRPPISNSSNSFSKHLRTIPSTPTTVDILITFIFHSFFSSLVRSKYLSLFSFSLIFPLWSPRTVKFTIPKVLFFFYYHHLVWSFGQN